jgi:hypothetical protein
MVGGGDLKSIAFFNGTTAMLQDFTGFRDNVVRVLNNPWDFDSWLLVGDKYGGVSYSFPYSMDIQMAYLEETSIKSLKQTKRNREFVDALSQLSLELIQEEERADQKTKKRKSGNQKKRPKNERIKKEKMPKKKLFKFPFRKAKEETE